MKQKHLFFYGIFCTTLFVTGAWATDNRCNPLLLEYTAEEIIAILGNNDNTNSSINCESKESEDFYAQENFRAKLRDRSFILKVVVTVGIIAGISYLLYLHFATGQNPNENQAQKQQKPPQQGPGDAQPNNMRVEQHRIDPRNMEHEDKQSLSMLDKQFIAEIDLVTNELGFLDRRLNDASKQQIEKARAHGFK